MKKSTIFLTLLASALGLLCPHRRTALDSDLDESPEPKCLNIMHLPPAAAPNVEPAEIVELIDLNPSKIPSLDASNAVGFLSPIDIDLADQCFPPPQCDPSARFRTLDGGCNNLRFPVWGQARVANTRIIDADYSDGNNEPRKAKSGRELPNVRHIRTTLFQDRDKPTPEHNLYVMQFGQIIAHDTEMTASKTLSNGQEVQCCNADGSTPNNLPKECLQIRIPRDDPGSKKRCLSVPRAADTSDLGCQIKPVRQQIEVTSFIDASLLYGSDDKTALSLRTFVNGKLRQQKGSDGSIYLENDKNAAQHCKTSKDNGICYVSGDNRVNQHPDMAVSVIVLLRMHNILCDELKSINTEWKDERLYQEARRLLIAMYQHITYNEFLPILIGKDFARANNLLSLSEGFDNNYDGFLNPTTISSFTAVAFRSIHSYIQGFIDLVAESRKTILKLRLSDLFFKVDFIQRKNVYDSLTRGMLTQRAQSQDQFFTAEISDFLFKSSNNSFGLDLISLDLARGRDFGEPSYNKFRQLCGLSRAKTFEDLSDQISNTNVDTLRDLYEHVDDIDFYAAGMLEKPKPGAIVGHTFQCVIGEMFFRWKFGDRFFYEFGDQPGSFKIGQLNEIRKTSLAQFLCMTSNIQSIQRNAFDIPSNRNPLVPCNSIPKLNLAAWEE